MTLTPFVPTEASLQDAARGTIRITRAGKTIPYKLNRAEWQQWERAKQQHYLTTRRPQGSQRENLTNVWFEWCGIFPYHPSIVLHMGPKWTRMTVDFIVCHDNADRKPSEQVCQDAAEAVRQVWRAHPGSFKGAVLGIGGTYWYVDHIPSLEAEALAKRLWTIITQSHSQHEEVTREQHDAILPRD